MNAKDEEKMRSVCAGSAAAVGDDEVGGNADEKSECDQPEPQLPMAIATHAMCKLQYSS